MLQPKYKQLNIKEKINRLLELIAFATYFRGDYVTKRFCRNNFGTEDIGELERTGKIKRAQIKVKDILWLIRGISEEVQEKAEQIEYFRKISKEEYLNG